MSLPIRPITIADAFDAPNFTALCDEYRAESLRNPYVTSAPPDRDAYQYMQDAGVLHMLGAYENDTLVGMVVILIASPPHYAGKLLATVETLFLSKPHRHGRAGVELIRAAESAAVKHGAQGLYISAPSGGRLEDLLPAVGYHETNTVFFRGLT